MLEITKKYAAGKAAIKKLTLLNGALNMVNQLLAADPKAMALSGYIYDTVNQLNPSLGRVVNAFAKRDSWVNINDEMPNINAGIVTAAKCTNSNRYVIKEYESIDLTIINDMFDANSFWIYQPSHNPQPLPKNAIQLMAADNSNPNKAATFHKANGQFMVTVYNGFEAVDCVFDTHETERIKRFLNG